MTLYSAGSFDFAGEIRASGIAKWDGATWSSVGGGVNGHLLALAVFDNGLGQGPALYAGGLFDTAGETSANNIARWDGTSWASLGEGVGGYDLIVWALTVFDDKSGSGPGLFAGGEFTIAGGVSSSSTMSTVSEGSSVSEAGRRMIRTMRPSRVRTAGTPPGFGNEYLW